ncbi:acyltransferase [Pseudarthrobacter sp. SSS035]|uniref:acyltransferase n=1 Tax=Pseudarthrobacter sp. SSS035 TaxID=2931399 RepID=UPI00200BF192|nr:acyltransferase [Pseudarthrobacter sp. SSS035]
MEASADVSASSETGNESRISHLAQVREGARLGENCIIGRGAYIGPGVHLGNNCKLQSYARVYGSTGLRVYGPAVLGECVFIGPAVVLTKDVFPRAINADGTLKTEDDWDKVGVTIKEGAAIGARAVCIAPVTIGAWATVAAGAVVTRDVPDFALVAGVPAKRIGWVGQAGLPLRGDNGWWVCPHTGSRYEEHDGGLREVAD